MILWHEYELASGIVQKIIKKGAKKLLSGLQRGWSSRLRDAACGTSLR